jgi:hypothetical protein
MTTQFMLTLKTNFPVWRTITMGTGPRTADDFRRAFKKQKIETNILANAMLSQDTFVVSAEEKEVDLVAVTHRELGSECNLDRRETCCLALELGLELCPNEVGPQLCLQYTGQPDWEQLLIGMDPIICGGVPHIFKMRAHQQRRCLYDVSDICEDLWGNPRYVFVLPR